MKYKILEMLTSWAVTPILQLNLMQLFIAVAEICIVSIFVGILFCLGHRLKSKISKK